MLQGSIVLTFDLFHYLGYLSLYFNAKYSVLYDPDMLKLLKLLI